MLAGRLFEFLKNNLTESSILVIILLLKVFILLNSYEIALLFIHRLCAMFQPTLD